MKNYFYIIFLLVICFIITDEIFPQETYKAVHPKKKYFDKKNKENGLVLWLDSSGMQTNGEWKDNISGVTLTGADRPEKTYINNSLTMLFDGSDMLKGNVNGNFTSNQITVISICRVNVSCVSNTIWTNTNSTYSVNKASQIIYNTEPRFYISTNNNDYSELSCPSMNFAKDSLYAIVSVFDGTRKTVESYVNKNSSETNRTLMINYQNDLRNIGPDNFWIIGGSYNGCNYFRGDIKCIMVFNRALTRDEINYNMKVFNIVYDLKYPIKNFNYYIHCYGNSHTYGMGYHPNYPEILQNLKGNDYYIMNFGISALTTFDLLNYYSGYSRPFYNSGMINYQIIWEICNDLYLGADSTSVLNRIFALCDSSKAQGYKTIIATCLPRSLYGTPADFEVKRQAVNRNVRMFYKAHADGLLDLGADTRIGLPGQESSQYYCGDNTHLSVLGYNVVGTLLDSLLNLKKMR